MSSLYILEPAALGKVLLKTTVGDIDIELWTKETPKACRNFIQLCMEGYYDGTIFHRVVPGFIVQGGDPNGDGTGGESCYGEPFKDEFHSRLRFSRRGLVAMANSGKDDNASQFFFTLGPTPELQNKHTIFGKVTGETVFNMLNLAEGLTDHNEKPLYPHKIISSQVLINPFQDIQPRAKPASEKTTEEKVQDKRKETKGVKNFGLLSFGMEAEEDEDEIVEFRGKPKSTHDLLDDPKLSKLTTDVVAEEEDEEETGEASSRNTDEVSSKNTDEAVSKIRDKLKSKKDAATDNAANVSEKPNTLQFDYFTQKNEEEKKKELERLRKEMRELKKEMRGKKEEPVEQEATKSDKKSKATDNELIKQFEEEQDKYRKLTKQIPKKGASREQFTLDLLNKFQKKLASAKDKHAAEKEDETTSKIVEDPDNVETDDWLAHELHFEDRGAVLAKDASTKGDDWFDIYDPRNPINKRKREKGKTVPNKAAKTE